MNFVTEFCKLPLRLRHAVLIWSVGGLVISALPSALTQPLGIAANLGFWLFLALGCVAISARNLKRNPKPKLLMVGRRRHKGGQARRRNSITQPIVRAA